MLLMEKLAARASSSGAPAQRQQHQHEERLLRASCRSDEGVYTPSALRAGGHSKRG